MPRIKELMTFDASTGRGRWTRMQHGRRYRIGVKKLKRLYPDLVGELNRDGTREAANRWWAEAIRELPEMRAVAVLRQHLADLRELAVAARDPTTTYEIDSRIERLTAALEAGSPIPGLRLRERNTTDDAAVDLLEISPDSPKDNKAALQRQNEARQRQARLQLRESLLNQAARWDSILPARLPSKPSDIVLDRTLGNVIAKFVSHKQAMTRRSSDNGRPELSVGRFTEIRAHMDKFVEFAGAEIDIDRANRSPMLTAYREHLENQLADDQIAQATAKNRIGAVKQFLRWCHEEQITDGLPPNIASRSLTVSVDRVEPETADLEIFTRLVNGSSDRTKLWLLLAANCGFRQADIADLRMKELDLKAGRIMHARVKTRKKKPPTVNYRLWPETLRLLREHAETQERKLGADSLVFVNSNGDPVATRTLNDKGKAVITDNIKNAIDRVIAKLKIPKDKRITLGMIRTTSADLIRKQFGLELQTLFLGNSLQDVASRYYTTSKNDDRLDESLKYLRNAYKISSVLDKQGEPVSKPKRKSERKAKQ